MAEAEREPARERITEVKRDQRKRRRCLGGTVPSAGASATAARWRRRRRRRRWSAKWSGLRSQGMRCGPIAAKMQGSRVEISHMGFKKRAFRRQRLSAGDLS